MHRLIIGMLALLLILLSDAFFHSAPSQTAQWGSGGHTLSCSNSTSISTAASGSLQLVALVANHSIYVCGFIINSAGTTNVKFVQGTGTNCATSPGDLTGAMALVANNTITFGGARGVVIFVPTGKALCVNNSSAIQISGLLTYAVF